MSESKTMQGRRVYPDESGSMKDMSPGDYGKWKGQWLICLPTGVRGTINSKIWNITEHDDGTITVTPSIKTMAPGQPELSWHGYLEKGVWRKC